GRSIVLYTTPTRFQQTAFERVGVVDRKSTRLNSSHSSISYAVFCLKKSVSIGRAPHSERAGAERSPRKAATKRSESRCSCFFFKFPGPPHTANFPHPGALL